MSLKQYKWLYLKFCINTKESSLVCAGIDRHQYNSMIIKKRKKYNFEGHMLWGPADEQYYLIRTYGDNYMELPPINERESHSYYKVLI